MASTAPLIAILEAMFLTTEKGFTASDVQADARARLALQAIAMGGQSGPIPQELLSVSAVSSHGLSGLALRAAEEGHLQVDATFEQALRSQWQKDRKLAAVLRLESQRIGSSIERQSPDQKLQPPILLKGSAVAARYADPALRPFVDIDLLVPAGELVAWAGAMRALGYVPENPWRERSAQRFDRHVAYRRSLEQGHLLCEIHSRLTFDKTLQNLHYESLLGHTEPGSVPGFFQLTAPAQLVTLAVHLANHPRASRRLIWYRDIVELSTGSNTEMASAVAAEFGAEWALEWVSNQVEQMAAGDLADPGPPRDNSFYRMLEHYYGGPVFQWAVAREMGIVEGAKYLGSKLDPRRFLGNEGRFDRKFVLKWFENLRT